MRRSLRRTFFSPEVTDETDLKLLGDLRVVFSELLEKFLYHFGSTASYTSQVITFPSLLVKSEGPGRPRVHIPPEVLEELRGLGFTWQKIASIFKVSRWTIMRRVRLFELENLSLSSAASLMKKSTISFATTLHAMGQPQENPTSVDTLEHWDIPYREEGSERV